nr:MAG TPA: hypothetical protein [Caudoviricetes sp.]
MRWSISLIFYCNSFPCKPYLISYFEFHFSKIKK